jgi:uncharacterized protein YkwD
MIRSIVAMTMTALVTTALTSCAGTSSIPGTNLLDLINQRRIAAGCQPVLGDSRLRAAAERFVVDMRDNNAHLQSGTDGHTGSDGSRPEQRMAQAGFSPLTLSGEINYFSTAPSTSNATANVDWWMNSRLHKAIIQDCRFTHAGVGLVYPGGTKWYSVVDFGRH